MTIGKFLLLVILPIFLIAGIGIYFLTAHQQQTEQTSGIPWQFNGEEWSPQGGAPQCANPIQLEPPTDINLVTAILYPGQNRNNDYKSHGGFAFGKSKNEDILVKAPIDAYLVKASRYIEQGELQYFMVFINPCGIMYRLDHLAKLTPKFEEIMNTLPEAKVDDSRTTPIEPPVFVTEGEEIATSVGFKMNQNVTFDLGVNDLRNKNDISKDASWAAKHENDKEYAPYGICFLDIFSADISSKLKGLPAHDGQSGKQSDYCML